MMRRAGRVHGLRAIGLGRAPASSSATWARDRGLWHACGLRLWSSLRRPSTAQVPGIVEQSQTTAAGPIPGCVRPVAKLRTTDRRTPPRQPGPPARRCRPGRLPLRPPARRHAGRAAGHPGCLETPRSDPDPEALAVLESAKPDDPRLLPAASALALYDPDDPGWADVGAKVGPGDGGGEPVFLGPWIDALRPVRSSSRRRWRRSSGTRAARVRTNLATSILADYAERRAGPARRPADGCGTEGVSRPSSRSPRRCETEGRSDLPGRDRQGSRSRTSGPRRTRTDSPNVRPGRRSPWSAWAGR